MKSFSRRAMIQTGLLAVFLVIGASFVLRNGQNFASIAYPPIPESHYKYIEDAVRTCKIPWSQRGLIAAVAWKESTFHPDSVSGAGAVGVMQVLRGTGLGTANEYQIGGLNASTFTDPAIGYKLGTCYLDSIVKRLGDGSPGAWNDPDIIQAALVAYNAGPARGKSLLAGGYSGPTSSLGYADRIMQAQQVYALDFAHHDQQQSSNTASVFTNLRQSVWSVLLGQSSS